MTQMLNKARNIVMKHTDNAELKESMAFLFEASDLYKLEKKDSFDKRTNEASYESNLMTPSERQKAA